MTTTKSIKMGEFEVKGTSSLLTASQAIMKHLLSKDAKFIEAKYIIGGKTITIKQKSLS
jgi:hypothetical protein